ncbi:MULTISPECIES: hypothetical protein [Amycolatopsis]|nr:MULTISPECIES: hypothetical protein [Amycolatopsis]
MKTLPERYQAPEASSVGCFATDTRRLRRGARDHRRHGRRRR